MRAGLNPRLLHTIALTPNRIGLRRVQLGMEKELTPDVPLKAKKRRPVSQTSPFHPLIPDLLS